MTAAFGNFWNGVTSRHRTATVVLTVAAGAVVRLLAAAEAYPVPGDGGHFVQCATSLVNGDPAGLSLYWSIGMIELAAAAVRHGLDAAMFLQATSLVAGIAAIALCMLLARNLFKDWRIVNVIGWVVALNPEMVHYSVVGYSEMPYVACLLATAVLATWDWETRSRPVALALGFLALGAGAYFKSLDACVACLGLAGVLGFRALRARSLRRFLHLAVGLAMFGTALFPLCWATRAETGQFSPGSKWTNVLVGKWWKDSKVTSSVHEKPWLADQRYAEEHGILSLLWRDRRQFARQWVGNVAESLRILTRQTFVGPFRIGPGWIAFALAAGLWFLLRRRAAEPFLLPAVLAGLPLALIAVCLVHDRLMVPSLPFFLVILSGAGTVAGLSAPPGGRRAAALVLAIFLAGSVRPAVHAFTRESWWWRYPNMAELGRELRQLGGQDDVLMVQYPHAPLSFYEKDPLKYVELLYGEIPEIEQWAAEHHVTLVAVSDQFRPHWPIARLFKGEPPPPNWRLLRTIVFPGDDRSGVPTERFLVYRRTAAPQ